MLIPEYFPNMYIGYSRVLTIPCIRFNILGMEINTTTTSPTRIYDYTSIMDEALSWYAPVNPDELQEELENLEKICKELKLKI